MGERVTQAQLARTWGVSQVHISQMVSRGQLSPGVDGKLDLDEANEARENLDPARLEQQALMRERGGNNGPGSTSSQLLQARTMEAASKARLRKLQFERESGAVVSSDDVRQSSFEAGKLLQQRLLSQPSRISSELSVLFGLPEDELEPAIRKVLEREMRSIVEDVHSSLKRLAEAS